MSGQFCSILIKGTVKSSYIVLIAHCSHRIHDVGTVRRGRKEKSLNLYFFFFPCILLGVICYKGTYTNWTRAKTLAIYLETLAYSFLSKIMFW